MNGRKALLRIREVSKIGIAKRIRIAESIAITPNLYYNGGEPVRVYK